MPGYQNRNMNKGRRNKANMNLQAEETTDNIRNEAQKSYIKINYFIFAILIILGVACIFFLLYHMLNLAKQVNYVMNENITLKSE